ncbi:hypothetical protein [Actinomadura rubrisoli]|uniref:Uncharacterized protein n=1 Tax=Actinomadura rubrisoli TaxID=2530368 RepID=A0A4R5C8K2_9ACTN|nr:hypothetical protein [Actinomadura rubrisoli]TDD93322.1 hypothetical protein E1298_10065 [Actinomadura rubrisoli]
MIYMGLAGRASVLVSLASDLCADPQALGGAVLDNGASLYLDAHPGFLRASLLLPSMEFDLDTAMVLGEGNVQEFLQSAYTTETVELHIFHPTESSKLHFACAAPGVRAVLDAGFDLIARPAPADLRATFAAVNGTLNPSALVPLRVIGRPARVIEFEVEV